MDSKYSKRTDEEDLSGCLLSGALQPKKTTVSHRSNYVPMVRDDISGVLRRDEEHSGSLRSGSLAKNSHHSFISPAPDEISADLADDDEDLSGCLLSMPLRPTKTVEKSRRVPPPPPSSIASHSYDEMSGDLSSSGLGSDWLYMN
jgi:hypothetical protein